MESLLVTKHAKFTKEGSGFILEELSALAAGW
jgi:hypothetical protein